MSNIAELDTSASAARDSESSVELRRRRLDEVLADFDARGVGLGSRDNLTREELYDEATGEKEGRHSH